jgi:hypothetical protein
MPPRPQNIGIKAIEIYFPGQVSRYLSMMIKQLYTYEAKF